MHLLQHGVGVAEGGRQRSGSILAREQLSLGGRSRSQQLSTGCVLASSSDGTQSAWCMSHLHHWAYTYKPTVCMLMAIMLHFRAPGG